MSISSICRSADVEDALEDRREVESPRGRKRSQVATRSDGELHRLAQPPLFALIVVVEEVDVQGSLHDPTHPDDALYVIVLSKVPVHPVEQVQPAVRAKRGHIVRSEILNLLEQGGMTTG